MVEKKHVFDRLHIMFKQQTNLQNVADHRAKETMNPAYIKDMVLAAHSELTEILNEINWKPWKKTNKTIEIEKFKEEIIDLQHFVLNLALAANMNASEFFDLYNSKNKTNFTRQLEEY